MKDEGKTKKQLIEELSSLRRRVAQLKGPEVALEDEGHYRAMIEASPAAIMAVRDGCFLFVNPAGARMLGFSYPEEVVGAPVLESVAPESQQLVSERIERLASGKDNPIAEIELIRQDGIRITVESTSVSISIEGIPTAVIIVQNISERKELETKIKESEERFRAFTDNLPATVYIKDESDRHLYANPVGLMSVKKTYDEFVGMTTRDLWPPEVAAKLIELDQKVMREGIPKIIEEWSSTEEGEVRWRRDIKFPIKLGTDKKLLGGISIDITEHKRVEESLSEQLEFERLIADIAAQLVQTKAEQKTEVIDSTLHALSRFLRTERSFLAQFSDDGSRLVFTNRWAAEGFSPRSRIFEMDHVRELPWVVEQIRSGGVIMAGPGLTGLPDEAHELRSQLERDGINSGVVVPIHVEGRSIGILGLDTVDQPREYPQSIVDRLRIVADMIGAMLTRVQAQTALQDSLEQVKELRDRLEQENIYLREEISLQHGHHKIIGQSDVLKSVLSQAEQVAATDSTVLILGETGTGKELLAHSVHDLSSRKEKPMLTVTCSAFPGSLIESELFGREKGAYTGALTKRLGRFEVADGSTIFLDEISELPLELQAKLLRVLEGGSFERLGSSQSIKVDVRVIAATNRDLEKEVSQGRFREDLYYRLNVFPLTVPPLRDRLGDVPLLVWTFVKEYSERMGKRIESIPRKTMESLQRYSWPGNVRELKNMIERAVILSKSPALHVEIPGSLESEVPDNMMTLKELEKRHIANVLETTGWRVRGKNGAAEILGLKPTTLDSRIKKLGIPRRPDQSIR